MLGYLTKIHLMSRIVAPRILSLLIVALVSFTWSPSVWANHHEEPEKEAVEHSTEGLQDAQWKDAPLAQDQDNKRFSQFAIDAQLEADDDDADSNESTFHLLLAVIVILLMLIMAGAMKLMGGLNTLSGNKFKEPDYNKINAALLLAFVFVFFGGILYEIAIHSKYMLPTSASEHGREIDLMLWITTGLTGFVFIITQFLLFFFAFKYQEKEGQEALYYPKNDKLEIAWTTIPAIVLTVLVLFGFRVWVNTTITNAKVESYEIELYAYQFGWKFRYPGPDGKLGNADYRLINLNADNGPINPVGLDPKDPASADDILKDELIMPKGAMVKLRMRSRDVLHAAHLPHFRAQMYCVPGTPTQFNLKPIYTTDEFRSTINKPDFNFELACNQICGSSHYAMRREIIVIEEKDYLAWMGQQEALLANLPINEGK